MPPEPAPACQALYVEGPLGSGKTARLVAETLNLIQAGVPTDSILILCSHPARVARFREAVLAATPAPRQELLVYTYAGLVRTTLFDYWPLVEGLISQSLKTGEPVIQPSLSGMEDTELLLSHLLGQRLAQNPEAFAEFQGAPAALIRQVVRRLRLRSENRLSREEMAGRSRWLAEPCVEEVAALERHFDRLSLQLRTLDASKQLDAFHHGLDGPMGARFRQRVRHLIADDLDETIPAQQTFIRWLAPSLETLVLAADPQGGSRRGYLNAHPYDWPGLKALHPGETVALSRTDPVAQLAETLRANWEKTEGFTPVGPLLTLHEGLETRVELFDRVAADIQAALSPMAEGEEGTAPLTPGDFAIVLPKADDLTVYALQTRLAQAGLKVQLLTGTQRPIDHPLCRKLIALLVAVNGPAWGVRLPPVERRMLLLDWVPADWLDRLPEDPSESLPPLDRLPEDLPLAAREGLHWLHDWLERARAMAFESQLYAAFTEVISRGATAEDPLSDLQRLIQSYGRQKTLFDRLHALRHPGEPADPDAFNRRWLAQVKFGTVADTPDSPSLVDPEAIVLATPQKLIDLQVRRPRQVWLDVQSREWCRTDTAPLYHAWVHSAAWSPERDPYPEVLQSEGFREALARTRAAHLMRVLVLLLPSFRGEVAGFGGAAPWPPARGPGCGPAPGPPGRWDRQTFGGAGDCVPADVGPAIWAYACEGDEDLAVSSLRDRLVSTPADRPDIQALVASLRSDQRPVLDFRSGTMAVSAVPGAGKTYVTVALLLDRIAAGLPADRILALTFMDSASRNLQRRLRHHLGPGAPLPVVSTIHGLAWRLLAEGDHSEALGFRLDDVTLIDDATQQSLLAQAASVAVPADLKAPEQWPHDVGRAITMAKQRGLRPADLPTNRFRLPELKAAYHAYEDLLKQSGHLDFTDLIGLAIRLLETDDALRTAYQQRFQLIVEDEAQDSSPLLQRLIGLLTGDTPNLVRIGDTNQSITTTFTAADPEGFRQFIRTADQTVTMDHSARCAPEIIDLANRWVTCAGQAEGLSDAFQSVAMRPVEGRNPTALFSPMAHALDTAAEELDWLVARIADCRQRWPEAQVAVLVKTNDQVLRVAGRCHQAGLSAIACSDRVGGSPVWTLLTAWLTLLDTPDDMDAQSRWLSADPALADGLPPDLAEWLKTNPILGRPVSALPPEVRVMEALLQRAYDWWDFSREAATGNLSRLLVRMAERWLPDPEARSQGYACAALAQRILAERPTVDDGMAWVGVAPITWVRERMATMGRRRVRGLDAPADGLADPTLIPVMTLHKAKGMEFDIVFIPMLTARDFPHEPQAVRVDEGVKLTLALEALADPPSPEPPHEAAARHKRAYQRQCVAESARLVYVGLSRARRGLVLSTHRQALFGRKFQPVVPAYAFTALAEGLAPVESPVPLAMAAAAEAPING